MAKRTIRRRLRKNKTIRKVMRGCNGRRMKMGGATIQAAQYSGASPQANQNLAGGTQHLLQARQNATNVPPPIPEQIKSTAVGGNITTKPAPAAQGGGARTRHHRRKLRYKKSIARKSRHA
jgi:hypothetical protein